MIIKKKIWYFDELDIGDVFIISEGVYMKTRNIQSEYGFRYNAVNLRTGEFFNCSNDDVVTFKPHAILGV